MSIKEKLMIHHQIEMKNKHNMLRFRMEQLNRGKLKEWREQK